MIRSLSLLALLHLTLLAVSAQGDEAPWRVFAEEAPAHAEPSFDSEVVTTHHEGDMVSGEFLLNDLTDEEWLVVEVAERTTHISMTTLQRVHPDNDCEGNIPIGEEVVDRWWGLPLDYEPSDLAEIPSQFTVNSERIYRLRSEVRDALVSMCRAALADDVDIQVASAYRSGTMQKRIYQRSFRRRGASQRSSARPGHSEHQLGTTVDLSDPPGRYAFSQEFGDSPQGQWLSENAERFGFRQTYRPDNVEQTGYIVEPWHWRYMGVESTEDE